jgi:hypothetical protein
MNAATGSSSGRTGTPRLPAALQLLTTLLRITPQPGAGRLWCAPDIPGRFLPLQVAGLRVGNSRLAIDIHDGDWHLTGLDETGMELIRQPRNRYPRF